MAKSAKELKPGQKNILVYGSTGGGKTTLFTTWPGKKLLYVFDPSTFDSIAGLDIDYEEFLPDPAVGIQVPIPKKDKAPVKDPRASRPGEPMVYANFEDHIEDMITHAFYEYEVVGFASLTSLQVILMERLLWISGRHNQQPGIGDYLMVGNTMMAIFRATLGTGVSIFLEGHDDLIQDEVSKKVFRQFDITKGVRRNLPRNVTDVWIAQVDEQKGKARYQVQTIPSREWPAAKNSFGLRFIEDVTLDFQKPREGQGIGKFLKEKRR